MKHSIRIVALSLCVLMASTSLTGCALLDKIFEPEEKVYESTMYKKTDKLDEDFNNYDGKVSEETNDTKEETVDDGENLSQEENYVDTSKIVYSFENGKEASIEDIASTDVVETKKMTFIIPSELYNVTTQGSKFYTFPFDPSIFDKYKYSNVVSQTFSSDNTSLIVRPMIVPDTINYNDNAKKTEKKPITEETIVTIPKDKFATIKSSNKVNDLSEKDLETITVKNGDSQITINYRIYTYRQKGAQHDSCLILAESKFEDRFLYTELWVNGIMDRFDYESFLIDFYSTVKIENV